MALKKYVKRVAKKVGTAAKKRYFKGKGYTRPNISTMLRDVALLKRSLNVEKKNVEFIETQDTAIGQYSGTADTGQLITDITPVLAQGVGYNQRTGNSVKLVSMSLQGQIKQQTATRHPMRIKVCLFKVIGTPVPVATIQSGGQIFQTNPLNNTTDYNSDRNVNYFRQYVPIGTKYLYLQPDPVSGEMMIINFRFVMKMSHHLKWNLDTQNLTNGQLVMMVVCDSGNASTTTAGTNVNVPVTAINTGAVLQTYTKFYYVDN